MAKDFTYEMFSETLNEVIKQKIEDGANEEKIIEFLDSDACAKMYADVIQVISENAVKTIEEIMYEKVIEERAYTNEFIAHMEQEWGKAFVASEALYICIMESSDEYIKFVSQDKYEETDERVPIFNAIAPIHARACQEYLEILCLCKNGFADGAYARWRSLYELSIMSEFIVKNGKDVANAFMKAADSNDRYDWAKEARCFQNYPQNKHITFSAIQKQCSFSTSDWKKQYNLSNQLVHASPQKTKYRIGNKIETGILSAGQSDYGVALPMVQATICLVFITTDMLTIFHNCDSIVATIAFRKWIDKISIYCKEIEKTFFDKD